MLKSKNCYADACIIGEKSCGGILGYSYKGNVIISDCYSSGNISINTEGAGGIAGYLWNKCRVCYTEIAIVSSKTMLQVTDTTSEVYWEL